MTPFKNFRKQINEAFTPKEIKMAIGIASDPRYKGGNYSGAVKAIEKIKKGLSNHKQVAAVLKRQNEDIDEPASPDEGGMATDQLEFIKYAADEIMQHIQNGGEFPEWMQNKLSGTFEKMKSLHANIDHENVQDQKESVELEEKKNWDRAQKELESKKRMQSDDREFEKTAAYIRALEGSTKEKATKLLSDYINSKIRNLDVKDQIVKILKNNGMWKKNAVFVEGVELEEKLKVSDGLGAWISDFKKSDAPQFKGKSDEEKKNMAIAAFTDAGGKLDEASEFKPHMMYDPKT